MADRDLTAALERLGAEDRALLELALRRRLDDVALADLLGLDPASVAGRREGALTRVAEELGELPGPQVEAALGRLWHPEGVPEEEDKPASAAGGAWRAAALVAVVAVLGVGTGLLASALGGDDSKGSPKTNPPRTAASTPTASTPTETARITTPARPSRPTRLEALARSRGIRATAIVENGRLRLGLKGLPPFKGSYEAWLYNSVADAVPLARFGPGTRTVTARWPARASRYRYLDISREPSDGNANHSGASVLRVPTASVPRSR